jgi:hypothetical protein
MRSTRFFVAVAFIAFGCSGSGERHDASPGGSHSGGAGAEPSGGVYGSSGASAGTGQGGKLAAGEGGDGSESAGMAATSTDDEHALIVPQDLAVSALPGGNGAFELIALTLVEGTSNTELYAALRNTGPIPACDASVSIELYDKEQQSVAAGVAGLHTRRTYEVSDGSGTYASCVGPGDLTMAAITDLPREISVPGIGYAVYRCNYFALALSPISGLRISDISSVTTASGIAYSGTLVNGLDVTVTKPSVTVFATNRVGRPLGTVIAAASENVPPGGSWPFQTDTLQTAAADYVAFPAAAIAK